MELFYFTLLSHFLSLSLLLKHHYYTFVRKFSLLLLLLCIAFQIISQIIFKKNVNELYYRVYMLWRFFYAVLRILWVLL